jgi:protein-tyrosine phosphatase
MSFFAFKRELLSKCYLTLKKVNITFPAYGLISYFCINLAFPMKKKILFVCMANICRSPAAEAVFSRMAEAKGLDDRFETDSAGIGEWYAGQAADERMRKHALDRNYEIDSIARKFDPLSDFDHFDLIIGMDEGIIRDLKKLARNDSDKDRILPMTSFRVHYRYDSVPDPYYGGEEGFELVLDLLEDSCEGMLQQLEKEIS